MRALSITMVVCLTALAGFAAQTPPTAAKILRGHVVDVAGVPVAGATVKLTDARSTVRMTVTDPRGEFTFVEVPVGNYQLAISLSGFLTLSRVIGVSGKEVAPVRLTLQVARPSVEAPLVDSVAQSPKEIVPEGVVGGVPGGVVGGVVAALAPSPVRVGGGSLDPDFNREAYNRIEDNSFRSTRHDPLSTFSIDVDTASYANVRRFLKEGRLPPPDAVRIEEMINYFRFDYAAPRGDAPFAVTTEVTACPWNPAHKLALVGLRARPVETRDAARNLVFLIDVSGSMVSSDKLPLVRQAMRMLVDTLTEHDRVAIVVYAGASGLVLPTTAGNHKERIHQAIARLEAGGSTNGGAGISLAYLIARKQFVRGGINRVILATDGDFNVGVTSQGDLTRLIEQEREAGIFLSVLGVGTENLNDATMEQLADKGNGNYAYLDSLHEARRVLVAEAGGTLVTVAKDVKIQVEFNPAHAAAYRLIGYENRLLRNEDFNDDRKDAGEIGAGHTVTALYEIVPPGVPIDLPAIDPLRYQPAPGNNPGERTTSSGELMLVKLRYEEPEGETSRLLTFPVSNRTAALSENTGFAAAVAQFGMLLRQSPHSNGGSYASAAALARRHRGADDTGYRTEFVRLVELAEALAGRAGTRRDEPGRRAAVQ